MTVKAGPAAGRAARVARRRPALRPDLFGRARSRPLAAAADANEFFVEAAAIDGAEVRALLALPRDVGLDPAHPTICGRCIANLFGAGEARARVA